MTTALVIGLVACGLGLLLLETFIRRPVLVAGVVVTLQVSVAVVTLPSVFVGSFRVGINDAVMALMLAAAVARLLRLPRVTAPQRAALGLLAVLLLSLVRGVMEFGVATAVVQSRGLLPFVVASVYFATVVPSRSTLVGVTRIWLWAGGALAGLAVLRWAASAVGLHGIDILAPTASFDRVLHFSEALLVVQAALLCIVAVKPEYIQHTLHRRLAYVFFPVAVLLQHRTAWAALLVGLAVMLVLDRSFGRRLAAAIVGALAVGAVLGIALFGAGEEGVVDSLSDTATTTGTWEYRTHGWRELLSDTRTWDPVEHAVGAPLGTSFERELPSARVTDTQPHNYYVHLYLRAGIIGLGLMVLLYIALLRRLSVGTHRLTPSLLDAPMLGAMLATQLVSFVSYAPAFEQGILLGLGAALVVTRRRHGPPVQAVRNPPAIS